MRYISVLDNSEFALKIQYACNDKDIKYAMVLFSLKQYFSWEYEKREMHIHVHDILDMFSIEIQEIMRIYFISSVYAISFI